MGVHSTTTQTGKARPLNLNGSTPTRVSSSIKLQLLQDPTTAVHDRRSQRMQTHLPSHEDGVGARRAPKAFGSWIPSRFRRLAWLRPRARRPATVNFNELICRCPNSGRPMQGDGAVNAPDRRCCCCYHGCWSERVR